MCKFTFGLLLLCILGIQSCGKDKNTKKFEIKIDKYFEIPPGLNTLDAYYFPIKDIYTNYDAIIKSLNLPAGTKVSLVPEAAWIRDPFTGADLDFIDKATVFLYTNDKPDDRPESFYQDLIPLSVGSEIQLFPTTYEAQPFLSHSTINAEVRLQLRRNSVTSINVNLQMTFRGTY